MPDRGEIVAGRYKVVRTLGGGGAKQVYLAEDAQQSNQPRVLVEIADNLPDPAARERAAGALADQARALIALHDQHLARVYDYFVEDNRHYIVREYVEGETLEERLKRMPARGFAPEFVINLALQILDGLGALHGLDPPFIYHNLKPSNVIIAPDGNAKLIDFGLARGFAPPSLATKIGARPYAAPEQYEHRESAQSDLYALGAIMHQMLSARDPAKALPFKFEPLARLRPELPADLCTVVERALAFNLSERIATAAQFKAALLAIKAGQPLPPFAPAPDSAAAPMESPGSPTALRRSRRQPCPHCGRRVPRDARTCPYCARDIATGEIRAPSSRRKIAAIVIITAAVAVAAIAGVVIVGRNRPSILAALPIGAPISAPSQSADTEAARKYQLGLAHQLDDDLAAFRDAPPGGGKREILRRKIIAESLQMNPPPGLPEDASGHLDRGDADLKAGNFTEASGEFAEALDEAPWLAQGYRGLGRAREAAGDLSGAIRSLDNYLLAAPQASDALEVKAHAAALGQRILASQSDATLRSEIETLQVKQQEEEAEQARIRAQQEAQEEAREKQQRQEQQRVEQEQQKAAQVRRCRDNFVGRWGEYNLSCCTTAMRGSTSFGGTGSGGYEVPGLGSVFEIELDGGSLSVYQVVAGICSSDCRRQSLYQTNHLVFDGVLTGQSTNFSGNCSFTAHGRIQHWTTSGGETETVPVDSVTFYVSNDGSTLTWGGDTYQRQ